MPSTYIFIYILCIIIAASVYIIVSNHLNKIFKQINYFIDNIYFNLAKFLETNKKNIIKYNDLIEYIFYPKKRFINWFHKDIIDFEFFWRDFEKQLEETEKILHKNIIDPDIILKLDDLFKIWIKLHNFKNFLKKFLCIFSFWIFCLLK